MEGPPDSSPRLTGGAGGGAPLTLRQFASLKSESKAPLNHPKCIRGQSQSHKIIRTHVWPPHCCACNLKVKWLQSHPAPRQLRAEQTALFFPSFSLRTPPPPPPVLHRISSSRHFTLHPNCAPFAAGNNLCRRSRFASRRHPNS